MTRSMGGGRSDTVTVITTKANGQPIGSMAEGNAPGGTMVLSETANGFRTNS